jgi:hypothetical protein
VEEVMGYTRWFAVILVAGACFAAPAFSGDDDARVLFLDVEGHHLKVRLASPEALYFVDPIAVQKIPRYTAEDGLRIAETLAQAGLEHKLVEALVGLRITSVGRVSEPRPSLGRLRGGHRHSSEPPSHTMFLQVWGTTLPVVMRGDPSSYVLDPVTGERYRWFSVSDGQAIEEALEKHGFGTEELVNVLLESRYPVPGSSPCGPFDKACEIEPLDPTCGECLNGQQCYVGGELNCCCTGPGAGCQSCKTCES